MNTPEPWTESAACATVGGDFWFPSIGESNASFALEAKRICREECTVRDECLNAVMAFDELPRYGIWSGYTTTELHRMRRAAA